MLKMTGSHELAIIQHLEATYPEEGCGLLVGNLGVVDQVWAMVNSWEPESFPDLNTASASRGDRFSIAPRDMLTAQKRARDLNLNIIGIYHSHPDHPAIPSSFDQLIAHPGYSYVIASVIQGKTHQLHSWVLDSQGQFQSEQILRILLTDFSKD